MRAAPRPASPQRQKRYRERVKRGAMVVAVEVGEDLVEALAASGFVDPCLTDSREAVREGVERVLGTLSHETTDA